MKITTPSVLSSTSFLSDVLLPSLVSTSPPKPSSSSVWPTSGLPAVALLEAPLVALAAVSSTLFTVSWTVAAAVSTASATTSLALVALVTLVLGPGFFFEAFSGAGGGVLRLRSSTMMGSHWWFCWRGQLRDGRQSVCGLLGGSRCNGKASLRCLGSHEAGDRGTRS